MGKKPRQKPFWILTHLWSQVARISTPLDEQINQLRQAIHAGLEILEAAKSLTQEIETEWDIEDVQVRIGIDTGFATLGGQTEAEDTVMGRVVNLAIRI